MPFMQKQIIAHFPKEINPFFKKIPGLSRRRTIAAGPVKRVFSTTAREHEKLHERRKPVRFRHLLLCKQLIVEKTYQQAGHLWITPVEKCVENVENPMFSTVIRSGRLWKDRWKTPRSPGFRPLPRAAAL